MLARMKELYDAKQREQDPEARSKKHREMIAEFRIMRANNLDELRQHVKEKFNQDDYCCFNYVDDLLTFPVITQILDEIYQQSKSLRQAETKKLEGEGEKYNTEYDHEIQKSLAKFEAWLFENDYDNINQQSVQAWLENEANELTDFIAENEAGDKEKFRQEIKPFILTDIINALMKKVIKESDERQMIDPSTLAGKAQIAKLFFTLTKDKVKKPYIALPLVFHCLPKPPSPELAKKWDELLGWMKGLHLYHAELLKVYLRRNKCCFSTSEGRVHLSPGERYPAINYIDEKMQSRTGLTFYDLALYVSDAAMHLERKLPAKKQDSDLILSRSGSGLFDPQRAVAAAAAASAPAICQRAALKLSID